VTAAIENLPVVTVAYLEGPVIGPGLELALACDYRLAVAGPDSWVSFGELPPGWGGRTRMGKRLSGRLTAREAVRAGVFDHAFCERRGKIELRTWLDRMQFRPHKRTAGRRNWFVNAEAGYAAERRAFREAVRSGAAVSDPMVMTRPLRSVGLIGSSQGTRHLAAELTMRGVGVVWVDPPTSRTTYHAALRRGRVTPLEAEQATGRIYPTPDADSLTACDWVMLDDPNTDLAAMLERDLPPRTVLSVPPTHMERVTLLASRPQRVVGVRLLGESAAVAELDDTDPQVLAAVRGWLGLIGCTTTAIRSPTASPVPLLS
jgi:hypothetical protein